MVGFRQIRSKGAGAAALLALFACVSMLFPLTADAYFNEVTEVNPAAQDLGAYESPIYGDQLPDGSYLVGASSTSRMCNLYAEPGASKYQATVVASGGSLTAVFYTSGAYTHLFEGTQDEAAAATNEDGTDASAYIAGSPDSGYVPHYFALAIPALNVPITVSTYNGGEKTPEEACWWTREFVFTMTEAELQAIVEEAQGEDPGAEDSSQDPDENAGEEGADVDDGGSSVDGGVSDADPDAVDDGGEEGSGDDEGDETAGSEDDSGDADEESAGGEEDSEALGEDEEPQPVVVDDYAEDAGDADGSGGTGTGSGMGDGEDAEGEDSQDSLRTEESASGLRGVRMNISGSPIAVEAGEIEAEAPEEAEKPLFTPEQILALAIAALFVAGIAARAILFAHGFERSLKGPDPPGRSPSFMSRFGWGS